MSDVPEAKLTCNRVGFRTRYPAIRIQLFWTRTFLVSTISAASAPSSAAMCVRPVACSE